MSSYFQDLQSWMPQLGRGVLVTVVASTVSMVLSIVLGLLLAIVRAADGGWPMSVARGVVRCYVEVLRGLPLIVTLFILYFGLPTAGITISNSALVVGIIGLTASLSAYLSEVFRAAILSIDAGQIEAARAFGMGRNRVYWHIILPQAFRIATPTLGGYFIGLLKDSSLLSFISVQELLFAGNQLVSTTFKAFEIYMTIGVIYLLLSLVAAAIVSLIERKMKIPDGLVGPFSMRTAARGSIFRVPALRASGGRSSAGAGGPADV
jgi:His/Glu/Gln/Arg/opine family amino acid ABC transporter permease subunit